MAAPTKTKSDTEFSIKNAISGLQRYSDNERFDKLVEALSYIRKKIALDRHNAEIFHKMGGISVLMLVFRNLMQKCWSLCDMSSTDKCGHHQMISQIISKYEEKKKPQRKPATAAADSLQSQQSSTSSGSTRSSDKNSEPGITSMKYKKPGDMTSTIDALKTKTTSTEPGNCNACSQSADEQQSFSRCIPPESTVKSLELVISVLANCSYVDAGARKKVCGLLGVQLLALVLKTSTEQTLLNRTCRCLANLATDDSIVDLIVDQEVIARIVHYLNESDNEDCQRTFIRALRLLSVTHRGSRDLVTSRGVVAVGKRISSDNLEVAKAALRTMQELVNSHRLDSDAYEQIVVSGCVKVLVQWFQSTDDKQSRNDSQRLIFKLMTSDQVRAEFGNSGGLDYLYGELKNDKCERKSAFIQCLLWCTRESVNRMKMRENGTLDLFLDLLQNHEIHDIHGDIIGGLCNFIYDENSMQHFIEHGMVDLLLNKLLEFTATARLDLNRLIDTMLKMPLTSCGIVSGTKYSMDSPTYEHNEWTTDFGDVLCKTSFEPIGLNSPLRPHTPDSVGGFSPTPSTSYYSPPGSPTRSARSPSPPLSPVSAQSPSPVQSPCASPCRSPSPPLTPPSPITTRDDPDLSEPASDTDTCIGCSKSQRVANHILGLIIRIFEMDSYVLFRDSGRKLRSALFSYGLLTENPDRAFYVLLRRLTNEPEILAYLFDENWSYLLSTIQVNSEHRLIDTALRQACCVEDCDVDGCTITAHVPDFTAVHSTFPVEAATTLARLRDWIWLDHRLMSVITGRVRAAMREARDTEERSMALANAAVLCVHDVKLTRTLVQMGADRCLVKHYLCSVPEHRSRLAFCLAQLGNTDDHVTGTSATTTKTGSKRKRQPSTDDQTNKKPRLSCHDDEDNECDNVNFVLDDGSEVKAPRTILCETSDVFRSMLTGDFSESGKSSVELKQVGKLHLQYVINLLLNREQDCLDMKDLVKVLLLADRFLLDTVFSTVVKEVSEKLDFSNFLMILETAVLLHSDILAKKCFTWLFKHRMSVGSRFKLLSEISKYPDCDRRDLVQVVSETLSLHLITNHSRHPS